MAEKQGLVEDSEEAIRKKQAEAEQRRKESHDLVAESIRRELLESKCQYCVNDGRLCPWTPYRRKRRGSC